MKKIDYIEWLLAKIEDIIKNEDIEYHVWRDSDIDHIYDAEIIAREKNLDIHIDHRKLSLIITLTTPKDHRRSPLARALFDKWATTICEAQKDPLKIINCIRDHIKSGRLEFQDGELQVKTFHRIDLRRAIIEVFSGETTLIVQPAVAFAIHHDNKKYIEILPSTKIFKLDPTDPSDIADLIAEVL